MNMHLLCCLVDPYFYMQLFSADATIFSQKNVLFCPQKVEKTTLKIWKTQIHLLPWAAQMALTEEFMFQNVAYRATVYRTGQKCIKKKICPTADFDSAAIPPLIFSILFGTKNHEMRGPPVSSRCLRIKSITFITYYILRIY